MGRWEDRKTSQHTAVIACEVIAAVAFAEGVKIKTAAAGDLAKLATAKNNIVIA